MMFQTLSPVSRVLTKISVCLARLLGPLWHRSVLTCKSCSNSSTLCKKHVMECQMSDEALKAFENKLRSLERLLTSRKINKRGIYARVFGDDSQNSELSDSPIDFAVTEVGKFFNEILLLPIFLVRVYIFHTVLLGSSEALFLLQFLSKHDLTRLFQSFDIYLGYKLLYLSFANLIYSEKGQMLITRLISTLLEFYTGCDNGKATVDDIIAELSKGCPSYFKEKTYKFYLAMDYLERAAKSSDIAEKENLAAEAFNYLKQVQISADLHAICRKFECLRFYDAVVLLPLQEAQALAHGENASNKHDVAQRENCYEITARALRNLKGEETLHKEFGCPSVSSLDPSARKKYISHIVQLVLQSPDKVFHEYLYRTMIDIGLENELLEFAVSPKRAPY
ncbi:hypothetical protein RND81_02G056700 [Saponaria officinalis]|uniref:Nucleoporin Nup133/Nup155-like C-terminal domain-containing protein n=1 Tax=Saponaria officinalis TaxID=3572 RepID=A0AAW1MSV8_SAPOF